MRSPPPFSRLGTVLVVTAAVPLAVAGSTDHSTTDRPPLALSSTEQGTSPLEHSFDWGQRREWIRDRRQAAVEDTLARVHFRTYYFDRDAGDGLRSQAWAAGGWAGLKTGYFLDRVSFGITGYTSQRVMGDEDRDGTLLLAPGQESYAVVGELFVDLRLTGDLNVYLGRKEFDTPYINRDDSRMTPNTFEAAVLQGRWELGGEAGLVKYGGGYFDQIKERNADVFVPMSVGAGAEVSRGVWTAGALYQRGGFSAGLFEYYSDDIINIVYGEAKYEFESAGGWKPRMAVQFSDQRSMGDDLLRGEGFSAWQAGLRVEASCGGALFTAACTHVGDGDDLSSPWGGYPGYTRAQILNFGRGGEGALLLRAGYQWTALDGVSVSGTLVRGIRAGDAQVRSDEYGLDAQWSPSRGLLKGLRVRARYAHVPQAGGSGEDVTEVRVICGYDLPL